MARIRSIHPGFFTDEDIVLLSPQAQVFLIGLWTEADDQGVFEWKPVRLKMRLLPVANADVGALLAELEKADAIQKVEIDGVEYGLVRNFRKFQSPKYPKYSVLLSDDLRKYAGSTLAIPPKNGVEDDTLERNEEKPADKVVSLPYERRGEERRIDSCQPPPAETAGEDPDFETWFEAYPRRIGKGQARKAYRSARKKTDSATLLAGAHRATERYAGTQDEFIPHPSTWLNGERWLDQAPSPRPKITPLGVGG